MNFFKMGSMLTKRYLVIDFKFARLTIYKKKNDEATAKQILFRDVQSYQDLEWQGSKQTSWCYQFLLKTTARNYLLIAPTEQDKIVWLDAFDYMIPSTSLLQNIIKEGEQSYYQEITRQAQEANKLVIN